MLPLLCRLVLILGLPSAAVGAIPSLHDRDSLESAANDDRVKAMQQAKDFLESTDPTKAPVLWMRALWFYKQVNEYRSDYAVPDDYAKVDIPNLKEALQTAIGIAEREKLYDDLFFFKEHLEEEESKNKEKASESKPEEIRASFESDIQNARAVGARLAEANYMTQYAFFLRYQGDLEASLKMLVDASKVINESPNASELHIMLMKTDLALAMAFHNQPDESEQIQKEIEEYCKRVKLLEYCLVNRFNYGKLLVDQDDMKTVARALPYLEDSLAVAEAAKAIWMKGNIHSASAIYHNKMKDYAKGLQHADEAIQIFQKLGEELRLINSYKRGAVSLIGLKRYAEALHYIKKARESVEASAPFINELDELGYQAYLGLGDIKQALIHLERHSQNAKKLATELEKSDYSKLKVSMGLEIQEAKNKVLSQENEIKNQKLRETERLRIFIMALLGLSAVVILSLSMAIIRSREVKISREKMQTILKNIEQGILTVNSELRIDSEYSQYLGVLLGIPENLSGRDALPILLEKTTLTPEEQSMIHESLRVSIGEDAMQWSFNAHNLPHELIYPGDGSLRIVAVQWLPLYDRNNKVRKILIGLMDVTERRKLEAEVQLEREKSDRQNQIIPELANADLNRVEKLLEHGKALVDAIQSQPSGEMPGSGILQELHTIKGAARTLGLRYLSSQAHITEDQLRSTTAEQKIDLNTIGASFRSSIMAYEGVFRHIFRGQRPQKAKEPSCLSHALDGMIPDLVDRLRNSGLELRGLVIVDHVLPWPHELLAPVETILLHALTNAADHGFILPSKAGHRGFEPQFQIKAQRRETGIELTVADNGAGLNMEKLTLLANRMGWSPKTGQPITDVLFLDGASTAESVSHTSGRGIGMSAIRRLCQEWNGDVRMEPNPTGTGAQLVANLSVQRRKDENHGTAV